MRIGPLVGIAAVLTLIACDASDPVKPDTVAPADDWRARTLAFKPGEGLSTSRWSYTAEDDSMTAGRDEKACVWSGDVVTLEPPYRPTSTSLCFRKARGRLTAWLALNNDGQFVCSAGSSGCRISVRVDERQKETFHASIPSDYSHDAVIIDDANGLLKRVRGASTLRIEATYYNAGTQISTFEVRGLGGASNGTAWKP